MRHSAQSLYSRFATHSTTLTNITLPTETQMSRRLTKSLLAATAATAVIALSIFAGQSALAADPDDNIAQARNDCNAKSPDCGSLDGNALTSCELRVGQIVHACNKVRVWEDAHGGPGSRFNNATRTRDKAVKNGEVD
jgi:hypothetical protein